jgi:hypothetical protein
VEGFAKQEKDLLLWLAELLSFPYLLLMAKDIALKEEATDIQKLWRAHQEVLSSGRSSLFSAETAEEIRATGEVLSKPEELCAAEEEKGRKGAGKDLCSSSPAHSSLSKRSSVPVPLGSS